MLKTEKRKGNTKNSEQEGKRVFQRMHVSLLPHSHHQKETFKRFHVQFNQFHILLEYD